MHVSCNLLKIAVALNSTVTTFTSFSSCKRIKLLRITFKSTTNSSVQAMQLSVFVVNLALNMEKHS